MSQAEFKLGGLSWVRSATDLHERIQVIIRPSLPLPLPRAPSAPRSPATGRRQILSHHLKVNTGWRCRYCAVRRVGEPSRGCSAISSRCSRANGYIDCGYNDCGGHMGPHDMVHHIRRMETSSSDDDDDGDDDEDHPIARLS